MHGTQVSGYGLLAVTTDGRDHNLDIGRATQAIGAGQAEAWEVGTVRVWSSGPERVQEPEGGTSVALAPTVWPGDGRAAVAPPYAAARWPATVGPLTVTADPMGFRQLYVTSGPGWGALSTSAGALALLRRDGLDPTAVRIQSLLGWQAGERTLFGGVSTLPWGATARLAEGRLDVAPASRPPTPQAVDVQDTVTAVADTIRQLVNRFLDEYPQGVLQLTGGQDSRILLAAIPPARRPDVVAMTVDVPGSDDARIAGQLAAKYGMTHRVLQWAAAPTPDQAQHAVCLAAAALDAMADPVAHAALAQIEGAEAATPRLAGLGGEVMRGFYYGWRVRDQPVSMQRVERLAGWRLFPNESVPDDLLHAAYGDRRRAVTDLLLPLFEEESDEWHRATDGFYLHQRMRRWAGVLASATTQQRTVLNPMLDPQVLALAGSLAPPEKAASRFLTRLLVALDPELAEIPLEGRPAPMWYLDNGPRGRARRGLVLGRKVVHKVRQRSGQVVPAASVGAAAGSALVLHWRAYPDQLDPLRDAGVVAEPWLDDLIAGRRVPSDPEVAFLANLQHVVRVGR